MCWPFPCTGVSILSFFYFWLLHLSVLLLDAVLSCMCMYFRTYMYIQVHYSHTTLGCGLVLSAGGL